MAGKARAFTKLFPKRHIPIILISLLQAGKNLRKKTANDLEDWISRRLYWRLIRIYPFRDGPLDIRLQPEIVFVDSDENTPAGKIDLVVSCGLGAEIYFAIEAKRLRVRSNSGRINAGNDNYVNNGMMRFVAGQYAPFMSTGAMLGYVFDGDINKARSGVAGYIKSREKELKLTLPKELTRASILPDEVVYETRHGLKKCSFLIYHIFLAV
jgi:hypothetical protein